MPILARKLKVTGRVQGVAFRESMRKYAEQAGITGWVRNCADGSVEAFVQGDLAPLEDILQWARGGPPGARVDDLVTEEGTPDPSLLTFKVR